MKLFIVTLLALSSTLALANDTKIFKANYAQEAASESWVTEIAYANAARKAEIAGYTCPAEYSHTIQTTSNGKLKAEVQVECSKRTVSRNDITVSGTIPAGHELKRVYSTVASVTEDAFRCGTFSLQGWIGVKFKEVKADVAVNNNEQTFVAKISGKKLDDLEYSYCKYRGGAQLTAEFVDANGEIVTQDL